MLIKYGPVHTHKHTHTHTQKTQKTMQAPRYLWEYESKEYNWLYLCCNTSIIRQHLKNYQPFAETITSLIPKSTIRTNLQLTLKQIIPALQPKSTNKQSCNQTLAKSNMLKNYCKNILHCWTTTKSITGEPLHCNYTPLLKHCTCLNRTSLQKSLQKFNYILQETVSNIPASSTEKTNKYQQKRRRKTRSENQARDEWQSISKGACTTDQ